MIRKRMRFKGLAQLLVLAGATVVAGACGGTLFKVRPAAELQPLRGPVKTATAAGLTIKVAPLLSDEESQDLFEANLPLSGVLPVRVELDHESGLPVELKHARFRLTEAGREWKVLSKKAAISRILKANGVFAYNPNSRKQFVEDFGAYVLDQKTPLSAAEGRRQGFLFFQTPDQAPVKSPHGLVLSVVGLAESVEIKLD